LLKLQGVAKSFDGLVALSDISWSVEKHEILGLIGPNGAGKTTLFNLISGFIPPDRGSISLEGQTLIGKRPDEVCRLGIARTFQIVQPFARLSVLDNVVSGRLFGDISGGAASLRQARDECRSLLESIAPKLQPEQTAGTLTLSDRKRLEMVRALATKPLVLLLDETMAGLNAAEAAETVEVIQGIRERFGIAIVLIEHDVKSVVALSNRIAVINHGVVVAEGPPAEVVRRPEVIEAYLGVRAPQN
jgi:branched-chain amino acid transport system ATP-binding protein